MKSVEELFSEALGEINGVEVMNEIALEIKKVTEALAAHELEKWSSEMLSRALTKISILRVNLGSEMADAIAMYDYAYLNRKFRYASEWNPTKDKLSTALKKATVQDIDSTIMIKLYDDNRRELIKKHYSERLKILYDSTATLITALQTRIKVIDTERKESQYNR
jgi:hypothetical protein